MIHKKLAGSVIHVWSEDEALDKSDQVKFAAAWAAFLKEPKLEALAPVLRGGTQPAVFRLRPLNREQHLQLQGLRGLTSDNDVIGFGLQEVSEFWCDGRKIQVEHENTPLGPFLKKSTLDALYDPMLFRELAERVLQISRIDPTRGQG